MSKKAISVYMAATCAIGIVSPGRFVCGLVIAVEIFMLMILGDLFRSLLKVLKLEKIQQVLLLIFVVYITGMVKLFLTFIMPELALQMGFLLFLPAISTFTTVFLIAEDNLTLKNRLASDFPAALLFASYMLFVSLLRDFFCYGTISLPNIGRPLEIVLFNSESVSAMTFLATIPGALILTSLLLALFLFIENKIHILQKVGL